MKKFLSLLAIVFIFLLSGCENATLPEYKMEDDNYKLTIVNCTNKYIHYSIIEGVTYATSVKQFNLETHTFLKDFTGTSINKQLISPAGTISGEYKLDQSYHYIPKGKYNCTIFVCKSNTYNNKEDEYINKQTFYLNSDMTITIGSNGAIY